MEKVQHYGWRWLYTSIKPVHCSAVIEKPTSALACMSDLRVTASKGSQMPCKRVRYGLTETYWTVSPIEFIRQVYLRHILATRDSLLVALKDILELVPSPKRSNSSRLFLVGAKDCLNCRCNSACVQQCPVYVKSQVLCLRLGSHIFLPDRCASVAASAWSEVIIIRKEICQTVTRRQVGSRGGVHLPRHLMLFSQEVRKCTIFDAPSFSKIYIFT